MLVIRDRQEDGCHQRRVPRCWKQQQEGRAVIEGVFRNASSTAEKPSRNKMEKKPPHLICGSCWWMVSSNRRWRTGWVEKEMKATEPGCRLFRESSTDGKEYTWGGGWDESKGHLWYSVFDRGRYKHTLQVERKRWVIPGWEGWVGWNNPVSSRNQKDACLSRSWGPSLPNQTNPPWDSTKFEELVMRGLNKGTENGDTAKIVAFHHWRPCFESQWVPLSTAWKPFSVVIKMQYILAPVSFSSLIYHHSAHSWHLTLQLQKGTLHGLMRRPVILPLFLAFPSYSLF